MLSFSQFGSDLDPATKKILTHGAILMETLKQKQYNPYPLWKQVFELFAVQQNYLDNLQKKEVRPFLDELNEYAYARKKEVFDEIQTSGQLSDEQKGILRGVIESFIAERK